MIDRRIYPLLQTLAAADLEWLAREIEDGIATGHVVAADPEQLALARDLAGRQNQDKGFKAIVHLDGRPDEPFTDEEQLDYAATYTISRLTDVLDYMNASLANLGQLLETDVRPPPGASPGLIALVLINRDAMTKAGHQELAAAKEGLAELREAIMAWRSSPEMDGDTL